MILKIVKIILLTHFLLIGQIAFSKKIILTTLNWEPYYGSKLLDDGYVTEIVKESFKQSGYDFEIKWQTWKAAVATATSGKYDGLLGAYFSEKRAKVFNYSDPIAIASVVFFRMKHNKKIQFKDKYSSLRDLVGLSIGIVRGGFISKDFHAADYLKVEEGTGAEINLKLLVNKRIDLIADGKEYIMYYINKNYNNRANDFIILTPPISKNDLYITITKKKKNGLEIIEKFNQGLKQIKQSGLYDRILIKHGVK